MCEIPESFSRCLLEMPKLRSLCIWPDTFSEHVRRDEFLSKYPKTVKNATDSMQLMLILPL